MRIQSLLNNTKIKAGAIIILLFIIVLIFVSLNSIKNDRAQIIYHQSLWNEYAPEIDRAFAGENLVVKANISHIYGGIASHHIPLTIPKIVEFYIQLKKTQEVKNIIVIGPDHNNAGKSPITVSSASFFTTYGEVKPVDGLAVKLENSGLANIEEAPFDKEHSVGSQILVISKIFPGVRVTPIILRSDTSREQAEALGKTLSGMLNENTVLISSVDFSHYLATNQAHPIDQISGEIVRSLDLSSLSLVKVDSEKTLLAFMVAMGEKNAKDSSNFSVLNSDDLMENSDNTTGYIFGFWGVNNIISGNDKETKLLFVGDIMLSRNVGSSMLTKGDWNYPFEKISDYIKNADLSFGNLEGPISINGIKVGSIYSFRADPRSIEGLLYSGFDVLSVANNHMWDYGSEAFKDTLKNLKDNKINYVGGGLSYDEAHTPLIKEINNTKVAYLAYTNLLPSSLGMRGDKPTIAYPNQDQISLDIQNAKKISDIVIVSFHWGEEYETHHNSYQEKLAHFTIDAGVDLIVGQHPHVAQDVEEYNGKYIAYSLGNFIFDQNFSKDTNSGLILKVTIKNKKIEDVKTQKIGFTHTYQPYIVE